MLPARDCVGASPGRTLRFADFVLEVDGQFVSGDWGAWHVLFRDSPGTIAQPIFASYGVEFYPNGAFNLWKNIGGTHINLTEAPEHVASFEQDLETNHLTLIARGPRIAVYMNGDPLWFAYDESSSEGWITLGVCGEGVSPLRAHFDNLEIWDISDLP